MLVAARPRSCFRYIRYDQFDATLVHTLRLREVDLDRLSSPELELVAAWNERITVLRDDHVGNFAHSTYGKHRTDPTLDRPMIRPRSNRDVMVCHAGRTHDDARGTLSARLTADD